MLRQRPAWCSSRGASDTSARAEFMSIYAQSPNRSPIAFPALIPAMRNMNSSPTPAPTRTAAPELVCRALQPLPRDRSDRNLPTAGLPFIAPTWSCHHHASAPAAPSPMEQAREQSAVVLRPRETPRCRPCGNNRSISDLPCSRHWRTPEQIASYKPT